MFLNQASSNSFIASTLVTVIRFFLSILSHSQYQQVRLLKPSNYLSNPAILSSGSKSILSYVPVVSTSIYPLSCLHSSPLLYSIIIKTFLTIIIFSEIILRCYIFKVDSVILSKETNVYAHLNANVCLCGGISTIRIMVNQI